MFGSLRDKHPSSFRVLLVNDDGIDAEGFAVLEDYARKKFAEVVVCAPMHEHSGKARSITLHQHFDAEQRGEGRFAIGGTPTDCVIFGLHHAMKDAWPDLVISGINHGQNAGHAITYSGTFGAAFEAGLHHIPAIAFSQLYGEERQISFDVAKEMLDQVFHEIFSKEWPDHAVMNVNFPHKAAKGGPKIHWVPLRHQTIVERIKVDHDEPTKMRVMTQFRRDYSPEIADSAENDLDVLSRGDISISPVLTNWTCHTSLNKMLGGE